MTGETTDRRHECWCLYKSFHLPDLSDQTFSITSTTNSILSLKHWMCEQFQRIKFLQSVHWCCLSVLKTSLDKLIISVCSAFACTLSEAMTVAKADTLFNRSRHTKPPELRSLVEVCGEVKRKTNTDASSNFWITMIQWLSCKERCGTLKLINIQQGQVSC